jgi:hypothetical protein
LSDGFYLESKAWSYKIYKLKLSAVSCR